LQVGVVRLMRSRPMFSPEQTMKAIDQIKWALVGLVATTNDFISTASR